MIADFLIDGMLSGTGMRDAIAGGYVLPGAIGLSAPLVADLAAWQRKYEDAYFSGFPVDAVAALDEEGLALASRAQRELGGKNVGYFSNGRMERLA